MHYTLEQTAFDPNDDDFQRRRKNMLRDLIRYDPRRLMITREEVEELGIEYDEDDLYVPKP